MPVRRLTRRSAIAGSAALLAAPRLAAAQDQKVLKFVPHADLTVVDPSWSTSYITRNHAIMVYDMLYGTTSDFQVTPQMAAGHVVEDGGKVWTITLRDGLKFHDGEPVLAKDAVASIKRWALRDNMGQTLMDRTDELVALDDKKLRFRMKKPFALVAAALGKPGSAICAIMPERLIAPATGKPITEVVGSGPFRFVADERVAGSRVVYARNADYLPVSTGTPSFIAGPKIVNFDRVEWQVIPDSGTAGAALQNGEVDWWENPTTDLLPLLRRNANLTIRIHDKTGYFGVLRFNHLTPPFNNPAIRRAIWWAVDQEDYMTAVAGNDRAMWNSGVGFFATNGPWANDAGMAHLTSKRDPERAKREIIAAGYKGEKVVVLVPTDVPSLKFAGDVGADMLKRCGLNVDPLYMDWGSMVQRLGRQDAADAGGWNVYHTYWSGVDQLDPAVNSSLRASGRRGRTGWPDSPRLEELRAAWLDSGDVAEQKRLAREIQLQAFEDVPYMPFGQFFAPMGYRKNISGVLDGYALFWNVKRT
ncbi:MAG: ABC transporter substrate-binding protein [Acetobacteraceae bacterium]|nr:ABC transporter substrate-binding protein [Acetobacteraceae bacterium]